MKETYTTLFNIAFMMFYDVPFIVLRAHICNAGVLEWSFYLFFFRVFKFVINPLDSGRVVKDLLLTTICCTMCL